MNHRTCKTIFFAGTDTDVGKTFVGTLAAGALRAAGLRVGVYKPVESGCARDREKLIPSDARALWQAAGQPRELREVCPQRFQAPLAPPVAAAAEGLEVDVAMLRSGAGVWQESCDVLIVEGAGGLFSPLAEGFLNVDLVAQFSSPHLIIVAANRLGVIHHTLATCAAAEQRGIRPHGIILCRSDRDPDTSTATNADQISRYCDVPVLGQVDFGASGLEPGLVEKLLD